MMRKLEARCRLLTAVRDVFESPEEYRASENEDTAIPMSYDEKRQVKQTESVSMNYYE